LVVTHVVGVPVAGGRHGHKYVHGEHEENAQLHVPVLSHSHPNSVHTWPPSISSQPTELQVHPWPAHAPPLAHVSELSA
jgi:hypothetical protein